MMKTKTIFSAFIIVYFSVQAGAQCSVFINGPDSFSFCHGDSIRLTATGQDSSSASILDQSQLIYTAGTSARTLPGYSEWQSFTASITGTLVQIDIGFFNYINGSGTLNIFAGSGTGGTLLQTQTVSVICPSGLCMLPFAVSASVTSGQVYTFQFIPGSNMPDPYGVQVELAGTYPGGQMALVDPSGTSYPGFDMVFETFVAAPRVLYYQWSTGSGDSVILINASGQYAVTVSDSAGCTSSDTVTVTVNPVPVVNLGSDTTICPGQAYILNAGNVGATWLWQDSSSNQTFSVHQNGAYWVRVTSNGCSSADTVHITYTNPVTMNPRTDTSICAHDTVFLSVATTGAVYHWQDNSTTATYEVTQTGNYRVTVTVNSCSFSDSIGISVRPQPTVSIVAGTNSFCAGDSTSICATNSFISYHWNTGDSSSCFIAKHTGDYDITVTDGNHCTAESNNIHITVYNLPAVSTSYSGDTLWAFNAIYYQWYLNGNSIAGANADFYIPATPGYYTVQVTDTNGCKAVSTAYNYTEIQGLEKIQTEVFPNPFTSTCLLTIPQTLIGKQMEITDAKGRVVFKSEIRSCQTEMPTNLQKGIYVLRIISTSGSIERKLVKQ